MKSFSSLFCCLVLALSAAGCWVPELPDDTLFSCDTAEDCAAQGVVCAPRGAGLRGYCCTPTTEVCNGKDDNCNGQLDDLTAASCYTGPEGTKDVGGCKAGRVTCGADGSMVCTGEVLPASAESCNGVDDDCDGETDEGFNVQTDIANCGRCGNVCNAVTQLCVDGACKTRGETLCDDNTDDDGDGAKDCADSDCDNQTRVCKAGDTAKNCVCVGRAIGEANCGDGVDNEPDGFTDCVEEECSGKSCGTGCVCTNYVKKEIACGDGLNNDGTEGTDCADPDCANQSCGAGCLCQGSKAVETICSDGINNDGTEGTDCADTVDCNGKDCSVAGGCLCSGGAATETVCNDGLDNDGNNGADCADSDCYWKSFSDGTLCTNTGTRVEVACSDAKDNDGNAGRTDCIVGNSDSNCVSGVCGAGCSFNNCAKKETICNDRTDNDGDTQTDCADKTDCPAGTACTRTNGAAGTCQNNGSCA
ncbi:MAG TPA: MopE-related protein [Archangium sp.]|uniref:MopE-related protein n=1 Tax=Archangium sp. TaxID=1872627 RepID=UPI002E31281E|nr:MopE-related protein [Archangium sp.]HEX5754407.1 MopE-related protein [Archangium sp.]